MKNSDHCNYYLHVSMVLLFLMVVFNMSISVYLLYRSDNRMKTPDTEMCYFANETPNPDKQATVNHKTLRRQVVKREISSEEKTTSHIKSKSPNNNEDAIELKGSWYVKKSDLWEYCFSAEDFCKRNGSSGIKKKDIKEEEDKEIPNEECFIKEIKDRKSISMPFVTPFHERWIIDPFQDLPGGEFSLWIKKQDKLLEFRMSRNLEYIGTVNNYALPYCDRDRFSGIVYNGSYFCHCANVKKIFKFNLTTMEAIKENKLENSRFPFVTKHGRDTYFHSDEYGLWLVYFPHTISELEWLHINPETLNIKSKRNSSYTGYSIYNAFAAFGKLYNTKQIRSEGRVKVYSLFDFYNRNERDVSLTLNLTRPFQSLVYDWKNRFLYTYKDGVFFRYNVYFECMNETDSLELT